ncbi:MAG TPA: DUF3352 domain-containing protein [Pyrinomonadaceae bacterium]|nr:DUF3352 domain-containing protein [Pyrinomonadaceae bacterium]
MKRFFTSVAILLLLACSLSAQRRHDAPARKPVPAQETQPAPNFDTLIPANSYKVYFEIRAVGQLIHSPAVNDLLDPVTKLIGGDELKPIMKWLRGHADAVAGSRVLVAAWASRPEVPEVLVAIEFASPEEAKKFEPELRRFIPTLMGQRPSPAADAAEANANRPSLNVNVVGSLILVSEKPFSLQLLRPRGVKFVAEEPNFVIARTRFAAESLFLFIDSKTIAVEEEAAQAQRRKSEEEEQKRRQEEAQKVQPEPSSDVDDSEVEQEPVATPEVIVAANVADTADANNPQLTTPANSQDVQALNTLSTAMYSALFAGQSKWPDAIAAAANFEDEAYVVRALIFGNNAAGILPLPFLPHFMSGPPIAPQAASVLPADCTLFVSASLDIPQIYETLNKTILTSGDQRSNNSPTISTSGTALVFAEYEKKLGMKIKDEVLPMFGNELALAFATKPLEAANTAAAPDATPSKTKEPDPDPILALSIKDKDGVRRLLPKLLDAVGLKGASALAQTERKGDTEIVSYANAFAYAFVGDYLILAASPDVIRRAVISYLDNETLAGNAHFRNARRWQAREVLAQIFVSPTLIQKYGFNLRADNVSAEAAAQLAMMEPVSYSVSNEGSGPLHELHVPKSLVSLMLTSALNGANNRSLSANEAAAESTLRTLVSAEETYKAAIGDGNYGTLDQLMKEKLISDDILQRYGYRVELSVSTNKFEATAVPIEYEKTGKRSFFIDETAIMRAGDHGGGAATIADPPLY